MKKYLQFGLFIGAVVLVIIVAKLGFNVPPTDNTATVVNSVTSTTSTPLTQEQKDTIMKLLSQTGTKGLSLTTDTKATTMLTKSTTASSGAVKSLTAATKDATTKTNTKTAEVTTKAVMQKVDSKTSAIVSTKNSEKEYSGILNLSHGDIFGKNGTLSKEIPVAQLLLSDGTSLNLTSSDKEQLTDENPLNRKQVVIIGTLKGKILSVNKIFASSAKSNQQKSLQTTGANAGEYKIATILFNFQDNASTAVAAYPISTAREYMYDNEPNNINSIAGFYRTASYGVIKLVGKNSVDGTNDVYGYYTLPHGSAGCTYPTSQNNWANEAEAMAMQNGFDPNGYDVVVLVAPSVSCPVGGFYGISTYGPRAVLYTTSSSAIIHEMGHSLDLMHANSQNCVDASGAPEAYSFFDGGHCTHIEYGDPFSVMGNGWDPKLLFSVFEKLKLGVIGNILPTDITTLGPTQWGQFPLYPQAIFQKALRFPTQDNTGNSAYFTLEYRRPYGVRDTYSSTDPVMNGVSLRYDNNLIDTMPNTNTLNDAPLTVGHSYIDRATGRTITTISTDSIHAVVSISAPNPSLAVCSSGHPTLNIPSFPVSSIDLSNGPLVVNATITNTDSSICSTSTFTLPSTITLNRLSAGSNAVTITINTTQQFTLAPGQSQNFSTTISAGASLQYGNYIIGGIFGVNFVVEDQSSLGNTNSYSNGGLVYQIPAGAAIHVDFPNGGEYFSVGQTITISWTSSLIPVSAPIGIFIENVMSGNSIYFVTTNTGSFTTSLAGLSAGINEYKITMFDANAPSVSDFSDLNFSIN
ncbi:MAG: hypothetical protein NTW62_01950 [Candidatus Nomurabacteria bacterium]|nr:hypothetical protein [Candidatus Nomurabacteria bacterium]